MEQAKAPSLTYQGSGVDYEQMDPAKRAAQICALTTADNLAHHGMREVPWSRGESVYLTEEDDRYNGHVEEGLGTKNRVAEAMRRLTGQLSFNLIAQDLLAMIVNDMITLGVMPVTVAMHLAAGSSDWFADEPRVANLMEGFAEACDIARCTWGCGEMPTLKVLVHPDFPVLAGSAAGIIKPKSRLIDPRNLRDGDVITFLPSTGIHANGLTLAQQIAESLPDGYLTDIGNGQTYGDALLVPTPIYVPVLDDLLGAGIVPHYTVNVTGHAWRKLERATEPFVYVIHAVPEVPPVLQFIQHHGNLTNEEAYGNLNMGAGFALFLAQNDVRAASDVVRRHGMELFNAGYVTKRGDLKAVEILPLDLTFDAESLKVR
ncbi:MAG: AIR synthase-related protein [bacterium]|nr:AIR synthase-related protein [bacterium]